MPRGQILLTFVDKFCWKTATPILASTLQGQTRDPKAKDSPLSGLLQIRFIDFCPTAPKCLVTFVASLDLETALRLRDQETRAHYCGRLIWSS